MLRRRYGEISGLLSTLLEKCAEPLKKDELQDVLRESLTVMQEISSAVSELEGKDVQLNAPTCQHFEADTLKDNTEQDGGVSTMDTGHQGGDGDKAPQDQVAKIVLKEKSPSKKPIQISQKKHVVDGKINTYLKPGSSTKSGTSPGTKASVKKSPRSTKKRTVTTDVREPEGKVAVLNATTCHSTEQDGGVSIMDNSHQAEDGDKAPLDQVAKIVSKNKLLSKHIKINLKKPVDEGKINGNLKPSSPIKSGLSPGRGDAIMKSPRMSHTKKKTNATCRSIEADALKGNTEHDGEISTMADSCQAGNRDKSSQNPVNLASIERSTSIDIDTRMKMLVEEGKINVNLQPGSPTKGDTKAAGINSDTSPEKKAVGEKGGTSPEKKTAGKRKTSLAKRSVNTGKPLKIKFKKPSHKSLPVNNMENSSAMKNEDCDAVATSSSVKGIVESSILEKKSTSLVPSNEDNISDTKHADVLQSPEQIKRKLDFDENDANDIPFKLHKIDDIDRLDRIEVVQFSKNKPCIECVDVRFINEAYENIKRFVNGKSDM
ncbi:uncharacterized protein LOC100369858 [Saccoglossus kowalevskii]